MSEHNPSTLPPLSEPFPGGYRRFLFPAVFVLFLFGVLFYRRPAKKPPAPKGAQTWVFQGRTFGTTFSVKIVAAASDASVQKKLQQEFAKKLSEVDRQMSTYRKDSELSRFNRSKSTKPVEVSAPLVNVVKSARQISDLTQGAFDVTIGPVVNAWGFGPNKRIKPPTPEQMKAAKQRVGFAKLLFDPKRNTLQKTVHNLYVDLSAIAKGYGVDVLGRVIEKAGFANYMVEIGGEVRARGHNAKKVPWRIGIEKPQSAQKQVVQLVVPLRNMSMATSGNYRNYITVSGQRVSHLIDARTGRPVSHALASVSVLHPDCMIADAMATALFVLGPKDGLKLAEKQKLAALFLVPKGKTFVERKSSAWKALLAR